MGMQQKTRRFLTHLISKGATVAKAVHQVGAKIGYIPAEIVDILGWIIVEPTGGSRPEMVWVTRHDSSYIDIRVAGTRHSAYVQPLNAYSKRFGAYVTVSGT